MIDPHSKNFLLNGVMVQCAMAQCFKTLHQKAKHRKFMTDPHIDKTTGQTGFIAGLLIQVKMWSEFDYMWQKALRCKKKLTNVFLSQLDEGDGLHRKFGGPCMNYV